MHSWPYVPRAIDIYIPDMCYVLCILSCIALVMPLLHEAVYALATELLVPDVAAAA